MNVPMTLVGIVLGAFGFLVRREDRARARLVDLLNDARPRSIAGGVVGEPASISGKVTECRKISLTVEDEAGDRALVDLATARAFVKEGDSFSLKDEVTIYGAPRFESKSEDEKPRRILFFAALENAVPIVANISRGDLLLKLRGRNLGIWILAAGAIVVLAASFRPR